MYLPRRMPSMSDTATFTLAMSDLRSASTMAAGFVLFIYASGVGSRREHGEHGGPEARRNTMWVFRAFVGVGHGSPSSLFFVAPWTSVPSVFPALVRDAARRDFQIMPEWRRDRTGDFGAVVPAADAKRVRGEGLRHEFLRLLPREDSALQREAALGILGERLVVVGLEGAEGALGIDVQPDRLDDGGREERTDEGDREVLVLVVDSALGRRLALEIEHVAEVVEERRGDELGRGALLLGEVRALQRVLLLRDAFARVLDATVAAEELLDVGDLESHGYLSVLGIRLLAMSAGAAKIPVALMSRSRLLRSCPAPSRIG